MSSSLPEFSKVPGDAESTAVGVASEIPEAEEHADFLRLLDASAAEREGLLREAARRSRRHAERLRELLAEVEGDLERLEAERADPDVGRSIGGWRLERVIGRGGSSRVYRARRETDGLVAALKLFDRGATPRRVEREIAILRRIDHPAIVRLIDEGRDAAIGSTFAVTELVPDAAPITEWALANARTPAERIELVDRLRAALAAAHAAGIVHCDLSPGNVLIAGDGSLRLVDFGIARLVDRGMTATHATAGTPVCMAPEQVDPSFGPIGPWTDEYAAAVLAYRLLAGVAPYEVGETLLTAAQAITQVMPRPVREREPAVPAEVARWVDAALVKRVARRRRALAGAGASPSRPWIHRAALVAAIAAAACAVAWWEESNVSRRGKATPRTFSLEDTMFKAPDAKRSLAAGLAAGVAMMSVTASATAGGKPIPVNPHWYWPTASDFADAGVIIDQGGVVRSFGPVSVPIPALEDAVSISGAPGNGGVGVLFRDGSIQVFSPSAETSQVPLNLPPTRYLMLEEGVGMAIDRTGVLRMWGRSQFAGFGNPGHLQVPSDLGAVRMTRQQNGHVVALKVNGTVRAWGLNSSGQSSVPGGLIGVVKVSAGKYHTLALRVDGDIVGWGSTSSAPPGRYLDVAAGHSRSFAIREDGAVVSFGSSDCNTGVPPVGVLLKQLHDDYGLRGGVDCSGLCHSFQTCLPFVPPNTYVFTYPSICDTSVDFFSDCDGNAEPDFDQVMNAPTLDGNSNGILDSCETPPDCDANGIPDATEIADGMPDVDGNGVPDNCQCLADVNETGNVNGIDLAIVLGVWGTTGSKYPTADINQDGVVNAEDLGIVLAGWGPCP